MDFTVPADYRVKIKENEKIDKYFDFAREQTQFWNLKVVVIAIVRGALRTLSKGLEERLKELEIR